MKNAIINKSAHAALTAYHGLDEVTIKVAVRGTLRGRGVAEKCAEQTQHKVPAETCSANEGEGADL